MSSQNSLKKERTTFEDRLVIAFKGLSIKQIAKKLDIKYKTFWNWATERTTIHPSVLARIGRETGYSLNWLLDGEGDELTVDSKDFNERELAERVNQLNWGFFTVELFVYELAKLNEDFRLMVTEHSLAKAKRMYDLIEGFCDAQEEEFEQKRKIMYDNINSNDILRKKLLAKQDQNKEDVRANQQSEPQDLGSVDEFDLEKAIEELEKPSKIIDAWYESQGVKIPKDLQGVGLSEETWDKLSFEEKIIEIKRIKDDIDEKLKQ